MVTLATKPQRPRFFFLNWKSNNVMLVLSNFDGDSCTVEMVTL